MYKNIYGISGIFVLDYICPNRLEFIHTVHCIVISTMRDHSAYSVRFPVFLKLRKEIPLIPL